MEPDQTKLGRTCRATHFTSNGRRKGERCTWKGYGVVDGFTFCWVHWKIWATGRATAEHLLAGTRDREAFDAREQEKTIEAQL